MSLSLCVKGVEAGVVKSPPVPGWPPKYSLPRVRCCSELGIGPNVDGLRLAVAGGGGRGAKARFDSSMKDSEAKGGTNVYDGVGREMFTCGGTNTPFPVDDGPVTGVCRGGGGGGGGSRVKDHAGWCDVTGVSVALKEREYLDRDSEYRYHSR